MTWKGHGHGRCIVVSEEDEEASSGVVTKRTEKYMGKENSNTVLLVVVLVMGVALIFICFAMVAICYRSGPKCLSLSVSVPLFGWLNSLDVKFGVASEFGFQPLEPKIKAASKVAQIGDSPCLCLCSVWALQELSVGNNTCVYVSQDTSAVHNCSPMCTKE